MKSIQDIIKNKRKFVGRKKELALMEQMLRAEQEEWRILHFYASAGMGKTVLLHQFAQQHQQYPHLYLDAQGGIHQPEDLLTSVRRQLVSKHLLPPSSTAIDVIQELGYIAKEYPAFILLIDSLDQCASILPWMRDEFFNQLPVNIRVYTAGRQPLDQWQTAFGWENVVSNLALKPFSKQEWREYAHHYGIADERALFQIGAISKGIPLAVSLTCHWLSTQVDEMPLSEMDERYIIHLFEKYLLSEQMLGEINDTLLVLASLTYTFDQEMLEYMLGSPIKPNEFTQLCQSPFVETLANGGWMVKNGIRNWLSTSFKERFPDTYDTYLERANAILDRRIAANKDDPALQMELAIGKYFLQGNQFVRNFIYFGGQDKLHIRTAREEELPLLAELYQANLQLSPPFTYDDTHQEQYFQAIRAAYPEAIQVIEYEQEIVFLYAFFPLTKEIRTILANNPLTKPWLANTELNEEDWFYWLISTHQPTDWEVVNFFLKQVFLPTLTKRRVTCLTRFKGEAEFLKLLGFEHLPYADVQTASGLPFYFYTLDRRQMPDESNERPNKQPDELADWINLTKIILNNYPKLDAQLSLLEQCRERWKVNLEHEQIAERIYAIIDRHHRWLKAGKRQEKIQAQILHYAFLNRHGSHETVATLLDVPLSTYYRQLKKLIQGLAYLFQIEYSQAKK